MALRVWLPLNGNLENKGLSTIIPSGTPTFLDNGKIGKCISLTPRVSFTGLPKMDNFTILFWLKVDSCSSDWADSLSFTSVQADGTSASPFRFEATKTTRACSFHNNTPYAITQGSRILITEEQKGEWHHCGFSYDGEYCYTYIDGVLTYTDAGLGGYINNYFHIGETNNMVGGMNDLRIYDECLSQKQIKEISKGLICHYKLDTPMNINNLKRNTVPWGYNNYASSGSTCTVVETGQYYNKAKIYRMTYTPNETSLSNVQTSLWSHGIITSGQTFLANTKYCFWILWKPISHMDVVVGGTASNIGGWTEISSEYWGNGWYIVGQKRTGLTTEDKTDSIFTSFKCPSATAGTPIIIDFCCPHLVSGYDYILPEFNYQGTNLIYEPDSSGNGYNGVISGTLSYNIDSPRYSGSTNFSTPGYIHYLPSPINSSTDAFTFTCWFYPTQNATMALYNDRTAVGDGFSVFYLGSGIRFDTGTSAQFQSGTITVNAWNFIACVFDKNNNVKKTYINGVQVGSTSTIGSLANVGVNASIGNSSTNGAAGAGNQLYGLLSDVRIYCTALSADEILTMYKTSGIIDNKNNVYAYEFKEE